jgi:hypothetical protein
MGNGLLNNRQGSGRYCEENKDIVYQYPDRPWFDPENDS